MPHARKLAAASAGLFLAAASAAFAQQDPFIGQVTPVANNFCPTGWAEANGQLLSISQNSALFSLFGTTYGGDGRNTFALPDLRGRVSMSQGTGPGLPPTVEGEVQGSPNTTLLVSNLPPHNHALMASTAANDVSSPNGAALPTYASGKHYATDPVSQSLSPTVLGLTGGSQPFDQHQPSLVLRYCVALQGVFPSRN